MRWMQDAHDVHDRHITPSSIFYQGLKTFCGLEIGWDYSNPSDQSGRISASLVWYMGCETVTSRWPLCGTCALMRIHHLAKAEHDS